MPGSFPALWSSKLESHPAASRYIPIISISFIVSLGPLSLKHSLLGSCLVFIERMVGLSTLPFGLTLLQEGEDPFLGIFGLEDVHKAVLKHA